MKHSNNAARIRLWLTLKKDDLEKAGVTVRTEMVKYPDLQSARFGRVNPLRKVPAFIREDGVTVFESSVILNYLEDKYRGGSLDFTPDTPEQRQLMDLICRCHDLYIASPNCTQPGFSHTQGAMYLTPVETQWSSSARVMDCRKTRAAKIAEIWKQLSWLESNMEGGGASGFMVGDRLSLADLTWFPTTLFMDFMLPRVFGWPKVFNDDPEHLPNIARWWRNMSEIPEFNAVREDYDAFWHKEWNAGRFETIKAETEDTAYQWAFPVSWEGDMEVSLNYQKPPPAGRRTGRYIDQADGGELADEHVACRAVMRDARQISPPATLESHGFACIDHPSALSESEFRDHPHVQAHYYDEVKNLVKRALPGATSVHVFDHTVRESGKTNLNARVGESAAPVPRVHCDYTHDGAPRRLALLGKEGIDMGAGMLSETEVAKLSSKRFAFVNVWRSIDDSGPIMQKPLAVCDEHSVPTEDRFLYELHFPDRVGENYSLRFNEAHAWFQFPRMTKDECLVFKVYDKKEDGNEPRFVFHTSFEDPRGGLAAPPRKSIEARTIAFFDDE